MGRFRNTREQVRRGTARAGWAVLLALMLILVMAPAPAAAVPAAQVRQISYGETVGEILTSSDPAHAWQFEGSAGDSVSIQMDAVADPDFVGLDTRLFLEYEDGTILAEDDDGGEGTNSRIENFELPADGSYVIIATSYSGDDSGRYELRLDLLGSFARRIEYAGAIGYQEWVSAELTPDVVAHLWEFEGEAGDEIFVAMNALSEELDPFLLLMAMGEPLATGELTLEEYFSLSEEELADLVAAAEERGVLLNFNDDRDEGVLDSLLPSFVLPEDGRYFIVATSCCTGGSSGTYELRLDLLDRFARRIEYAGAIGYQERVSAELMPDVVAHLWEFEGEAGDEISVAMNARSEELDPFLPLLIMGEQELEEFLSLSEDELADLVAAAEERGVLLNFNDDRDEGVLDSLIPSFVLPEDGRYFIVATSCCTGGSSGTYELILDVLGAVEPTRPVELVPNLQGFFPGEGQAGSDLILTLEGENFSVLGLPVGVMLGGIEIPLLGSELLSDARVELGVTIPEGASPGEQEISFFFENGVFDGTFFVEEPDDATPDDVEPEISEPDPGAPEEPSPGDPGGDGFAGARSLLLPIIVGGGVLLGLMFGAGIVGLAFWRIFLRQKAPELPVETPSPPPDVRFEHEWDKGRQSIEPAGRPLSADVDIRFRLSLEQSDQTVDGDESSLHG